MDEANEAKQKVQAMTKWSNTINDKACLVEDIRQNYEVLMEEKEKRLDERVGSSKKHDIREVV